MAIKMYTDNFPEDLIEQLESLFLIGKKDRVYAVYVNTFLGKIKDANILTDEKLIYWASSLNQKEKKVFSLKKIKDISYLEKGIYGTITYHLSSKKTFDLKLNRKDSEEFYQLSLKVWEDLK